MDELTAHDYITKPLSELVKYADFSYEAQEVVMTFLNLKTSQLEALELPGDN